MYTYANMLCHIAALGIQTTYFIPTMRYGGIRI